MPITLKTASDIQKLINKVMPQLANFVIGRRGLKDKNINYQIALLRDSLNVLNEEDKKAFLSQSIHGANIAGGFFSFLESNTGLKLSATLGEVIGRYNDIILENKAIEEFKSDELSKTPNHAMNKEFHGRLESDSTVKHNIAEKKSSLMAESRTSLPKIDKKATLAMLAGFEPTKNTARNHKIAQALVESSIKHLGVIKELPEDDAAKRIQAVFKKRNKLAISAMKLKKRIATRTGKGAQELRNAVERTIITNSVKKQRYL